MAASLPPSTYLVVAPFWTLDFIVGVAIIIVIVALWVCIRRAIPEERHRRAERGKQRHVADAERSDEPAADVYDLVKPFAAITKVVLQMSIGVALASMIVLKILDQVNVRFDEGFLTQYVYHKPTLVIVGLALAYSAALELAYMLFTPGPDEAVDPLIMALAAAILLVVSDPKDLNMARGITVGLLVVGLIGLFIIRRFFLHRPKGRQGQ